MKDVVLAWSGGKDSTLALHYLLEEKQYHIKYLLTTLNERYQRVSMHGVRLELIRQQASSLGIPLQTVYVPENTTNEIYEKRMGEQLSAFKKEGIDAVAFGDIFLDDLRKYREGNLSKIGMKGIFPLWKKDTRQLANEFVDLGYQAVAVCIDRKKLDEKFSGRLMDKQFFSELPAGVDPCGENGEFHSFVFDGPVFKHKIEVKAGEKVLRGYEAPYANEFEFCDLILSATDFHR